MASFYVKGMELIFQTRKVYTEAYNDKTSQIHRMALQWISEVSMSLKITGIETLKCPINGKTHFINEKWWRSCELTRLFLDIQSDFEAFVQEVHNTLKVCLFKLPRGQSWGAWHTRGTEEDKQQPHECQGCCRVKVMYATCYVPSRRPPGVSALLSPGQVFLLAVMEASSKTLSARAPSIPCGLKSTSTKWLSVPPEREHIK